MRRQSLFYTSEVNGRKNHPASGTNCAVATSTSTFDPQLVGNHLNILIFVGIAIITVAAVKCARVSKSIFTKIYDALIQ